MKYGDDSLSDPIEKALEAQPVEAESLWVPSAVRQNLRVNPNPEISYDQGDGDKNQSQAGVSCTSVNPRLTHLPKARFDAKTFAVVLADLGRRTLHPPGTEEKFLLHVFSIFAVPVGAIGHTHRECYRAFAAFHRMQIPAGLLPLDPTQTSPDAALLGSPSAEHGGLPGEALRR